MARVFDYRRAMAVLFAVLFRRKLLLSSSVARVSVVGRGLCASCVMTPQESLPLDFGFLCALGILPRQPCQ